MDTVLVQDGLMPKLAFYQDDVGPKADMDKDYAFHNNQGLDPGAVLLPANKMDANTAAFAGKASVPKKRTLTKGPWRKRMKPQGMQKQAFMKGFSDEMNKIGQMMGMGGPMGRTTPGMGRMGMTGMEHGGVVSSKSRKKLGPHVRIVHSKSKRRY